jgi:hypothetical protein
MLTTGNIFFIIKSLREHELIELAFLAQHTGGGDLQKEFLKDGRLSTEEWYHKNLHSVFSWNLFKKLEETNLPLLI